MFSVFHPDAVELHSVCNSLSKVNKCLISFVRTITSTLKLILAYKPYSQIISDNPILVTQIFEKSFSRKTRRKSKVKSFEVFFYLLPKETQEH